MSAQPAIARGSSGRELALAAEQTAWTEQQLAALRHLGVERASAEDLAVFLHVCQRTGLDPFARQIYMIARAGKQTIQAGIDGLRLVAHRTAERTGDALSISEPTWCGPDGQWSDVWAGDAPPTAARLTVTRGAGTFAATALWGEYVQLDNRGQVTLIWRTRPAGMLAKCAEALALRKAFPQDLAGVRSMEETGAPVLPGRTLPRTSPVTTAEVLRSGEGWQPASPPGQPSNLLEPEPAADVTTGELLDAEMVDEQSEPPAASEASGSGPARVSARQRAALFAAFARAGFTSDPRSAEGRTGRLDYLSQLVGRPVQTTNELTAAEASMALDALSADSAESGEAP